MTIIVHYITKYDFIFIQKYIDIFCFHALSNLIYEKIYRKIT